MAVLFIRLGVKPNGQPYCTNIATGETKLFTQVTHVDSDSITFDNTKQVLKSQVVPKPSNWQEYTDELCAQIVEGENGVPPPPKEYNTCWTFGPADLKQDSELPKVQIDVYVDTATGRPCYVAQGGDPSDATMDLSELIDLTKYQKIMNIAGTVIPSNVAKFTQPHCVTICIPAGETITYDDVVQEAVDEGLVLPPAIGSVPPTGFFLDNAMLFGIGQLGKDADGNLKKSGSQVVFLNGNEGINASSTYCPQIPNKIDKDCDGQVAGYDGSQTFENGSTTEPAILRICGCFFLADDDDSVAAAAK